MELVSGRKPVGEFGDGVDIVQWVRKMTDSNKEEVVKILDPRLSSIPRHEVMHVFYVAMLCVEEQAVERPTMREVIQILSEIPQPPCSKREDSTLPNSSPPPPTPALAAALDIQTTVPENKKDQQPPADLLST